MKKRSKKKQSQLYTKYSERLQTEYQFNVLKANYDNVVEFVRRNPQHRAYYANWMLTVSQQLEQYSDQLDQPGNVSFSTVYGFAKDEDLRTVYRAPRFQNEINLSKMLRYQRYTSRYAIPIASQYMTPHHYIPYNNPYYVAASPQAAQYIRRRR